MLKAIFSSNLNLAIFLSGFSSGIPYSLIGSSLQAWLSKEKIGIEHIGAIGLIQLPYAFKFLWAPFLDRYDILPIGKRKGWMIASQLTLMALLGLMSFLKPQMHLKLLSLVAVLAAVASATQDMTVDAYRIEILEPQDYALGSSIGSLGYKLGMLVSGAGALFIADRVSWNVIYLIFSGFTVLALMTSFFLTEPTTQHRQEPIAQAFFAPFKDFFRRPNVSEIVAFLVFYKLDVLLALALMTPFLMSLQFTQSDIAVTFKFGGLIFNTLGTFIGTILIKRWGLFWCLWVFEVLQIASGSLFWVLAQLGHNQSFMIGSILLENLCSGMGNCAFGVFLMGLCSKSPYAASQFALATSIMAFTRSLVHWPAGYLVKHLGWEEFFLVAILTGVPSLYLLYRSKYWNATSSQTATP